MPEGIITAYSADSDGGVIKSKDRTYYFSTKDWPSEIPPVPNTKVSFEVDGDMLRSVRLVE
jgi:hypothetical protein